MLPSQGYVNYYGNNERESIRRMATATATTAVGLFLGSALGTSALTTVPVITETSAIVRCVIATIVGFLSIAMMVGWMAKPRAMSSHEATVLMLIQIMLSSLFSYELLPTIIYAPSKASIVVSIFIAMLFCVCATLAVTGEEDNVRSLFQRTYQPDYGIRHSLSNKIHKMGWKLIPSNDSTEADMVRNRFVVVTTIREVTDIDGTVEPRTRHFLYDTLKCRLASLPSGDECGCAMIVAINAAMTEDNKRLGPQTLETISKEDHADLIDIVDVVNDTTGVIPTSRIAEYDGIIRWVRPQPYEITNAEYYHRL